MISLFTLSACSDKEVDNTGLAAKVGNTDITTEMLNGVSSLLMYLTYSTDLSTLSEDEQIIWKNQVLTYLCIDKELIREHFNEEGKSVIDDEAKAKIDESIDNLFTSRQTLEEDLSSIGVTREHITYYYEAQLMFEILVDEFKEEEPPSEGEISKFYDDHKLEMASPATVTVSHILLKDPEHTDDTKAAIEDVLKKAKNGEDFEALAKEYSEDGSADNGGVLDPFSQNGQMVKEFEDASFSLDVGEISDIVETEFGFHIIKLLDKTDMQEIPLEENRDNIITQICTDKATALLATLKNEVKIEYYVELDDETGLPRIAAKETPSNDENASNDEDTSDSEEKN